MAEQPTRYVPSKEPFQYTSLNDFRFQTNDVVLTRVIKLEYLRKRLLDIEEEPEPEPFPTIEQGRYRFGAFFTYPLQANETVMLHTVADDLFIFRDFASSRGNVGILPTTETVCTIWRNPVFTGEQIVGGEQIGTMTIGIDGLYSFETIDHQRVRLYKGDHFGVKAPAVITGAGSGSFTFRVLLGFPKVAILFSGDVQTSDDMSDVILLSGDMQDGGARLLMSGDLTDDEEYAEDG